MKETTTEFKEKTIAIKFDVVIHQYSKGFQGWDNIYDPPTAGSSEFLKRFKKMGWNFILVSSHSIEVVNEWLEKYNMQHFFDEVTNIKPLAQYYIGDDAIKFRKNLKRNTWNAISTEIMGLQDRYFVLKEYLHDLQQGRIFEGLEGELANFDNGEKLAKRKHFYNAFSATNIFRRLAHKDLYKIVELGTGLGQATTLFRHLQNKNTLFWTLDRDAQTQFADLLRLKYPSPIDEGFIVHDEGSAHKGMYYCVKTCSENRWDQFPKEISEAAGGKPIDVIFFDTKLTRGSLSSNISVWLPHTAENSYLFFSGAVIGHDAIKVLIDDMLEGLHVYKFCEDMNLDMWPNRVEKWPFMNDAITTVGVDSGTNRPYVQLPWSLKNNPSYAGKRKILRSDFKEDDSEYDPEFYDVKYELFLAWPGMILLSNINKKAKASILNYVGMCLQRSTGPETNPPQISEGGIESPLGRDASPPLRPGHVIRRGLSTLEKV